MASSAGSEKAAGEVYCWVMARQGWVWGAGLGGAASSGLAQVASVVGRQ